MDERAIAAAVEAQVKHAFAPMPDAHTRVGDYAATALDVAAHLAGQASVSTRRKAAAAAADPFGAAAQVAAKVSDAVGKFADYRHGDRIEGNMGPDWNFSDGILYMNGEAWRLSRSVPGIHMRLPQADEDLDELTLQMRDALMHADAHPHSIENTAATGAGKQWIKFVAPGPDGDPELAYEGHIMDAAHASADKIAQSISYYAKLIALRDAQYPELQSLKTELRLLAEEQLEGTTIRPGRMRLYTISEGIGNVPGRFVFHYRVDALGELLREHESLIVCSIDTRPGSKPTASFADEIAKTHRRIERLIAKRNGNAAPAIEAVSLAILEERGEDIPQFLASLERMPGKVVLQGSRISQRRGHGLRTASGQTVEQRATMTAGAWGRARNGLVTVRAEIAPGVTWNHGQVEIARHQLPQTILSALIGRPVEDLIDHPHLQGSMIGSARVTREKVIAKLEPRPVPWDKPIPKCAK